MAIYKNITSGTTTTLITKNTGVSGRVNKMLISNNNNSTATGVCAMIDDGSGNIFYFIRDVQIPSGTTLILDDNLSFDSSQYSLRVAHDSGSGNPNLTIIIK